MSDLSIGDTLRALLAAPLARALDSARGATPCHLVGGALRDRLLDRPSPDLDAVVAGDGEGIAARLAERLPARLVRLGGDRFASFRLVGAGFVLDLWDRGAQSLEADLARRDLTVNSMALEVAGGTLADPFGGAGDLRRRRLRATTARSFDDDPLRVLRLARLASELEGFEIEPATADLARRAAPRLAGCAGERVREEIARTLAAGDGAGAVRRLAALDLYPGLWLGRPGVSGTPGEAAAEIAAADRALARLGERRGSAAPGEAAAAPPAPSAARAALLFANLRPAGPEAPAAALRRFRRARYLTTREARRLAALMALERLPASEPERRWFLHSTGDDWRQAAAFLAARAGGDAAASAALADLAETARACGDEVFRPAPLLDGHEAAAIAEIPPGPRLGEILADLERAQVEGRVRTRAEAARLVRRLAAVE